MFDDLKKKVKSLKKKKPEKKTLRKKPKPRKKPESAQEQIEKQTGLTTATTALPHTTIQVGTPPVPPSVPAPVKPKISLTTEMIMKNINPNVSEQEAFMFLQLCKSQNLNPFIGEAYLIKYSKGEYEKATMVVGKDVFTKRAQRNPAFDGYEAGIILVIALTETREYREGSDYLPGEKLVGGWAKVYKKDQKVAPKVSVSFEEYVGKKKNGEIKHNWKKMPATMIRKVALVQALREAFPDDFQGLYDEAEMGIDIKNDAPAKKEEPKKVGESKPDPKPAPKPVASSKPEKKPDPKQAPHPASREGLLVSLKDLCIRCGCKTVKDVQGLTGYDKVDDPTIPLKDLEALKAELEIKLNADKKTEKEARKVKKEDIE